VLLRLFAVVCTAENMEEKNPDVAFPGVAGFSGIGVTGGWEL
jgi:hypothetical protein